LIWLLAAALAAVVLLPIITMGRRKRKRREADGLKLNYLADIFYSGISTEKASAIGSLICLSVGAERWARTNGLAEFPSETTWGLCRKTFYGRN
jgi:hypothetical protein